MIKEVRFEKGILMTKMYDSIEDKDKFRWVPVEEINSAIGYIMEAKVEVAKGFTVGDLFEFFEKHQRQLDALFLSYSGGYKLKPFIEEARHTPTSLKHEIDQVGVKHAAVARVVNAETDVESRSYLVKDETILMGVNMSFIREQFNTWWEKEKIHNKLLTGEFNTDFQYFFRQYQSLIIKGRVKQEDFGQMAFYSLRQYPMCDLVDLELIIDDSYTLSYFTPGSSVTKSIFSGITGMTFREFIGAIIYEITYYGNPEDRNTFFGHIVPQVQEELQEMGIIEPTEAPDPKERILHLQDKLDKALAVENYEEAAKLRDQIEELKS